MHICNRDVLHITYLITSRHTHESVVHLDADNSMLMIQLMITGGSKVTRSETVATIAAHGQAAVIANLDLSSLQRFCFYMYIKLTRENLSHQ